MIRLLHFNNRLLNFKMALTKFILKLKVITILISDAINHD